MDNMISAISQMQQAQQAVGFPFPMGGGEGGAGGGFLAIIQQLLGQMTGEDGDASLLAGILENASGDGEDALKPGQGLEMLQELAGAMMLNPALFANIQRPEQDAAPMMEAEAVTAVQAQQATVETGAEAALAAEGAIPTVMENQQRVGEQKTVKTAAEAPTVQPKQSSKEGTLFETNAHFDQKTAEAVQETPVRETAKDSGEAYAQKTALAAQSDFRASIAEAKKQLAKQDPKPAEEFMDVDALQAKVVQNRPSIMQTKAAEPAKTEEAPLLDQLKTGIFEKLADGEKEFVVKLKPESLGEITIKLLEKSGRTTLSIMTANSQTAKMISGELSALREAVKPMQVEVNEVIHQPEGQEALSQHFNMSGQQFAGEQQRQAFNQRQSGAWRFSGDEELPQEFTQVLENQGLDTYV